MVQSREGYWVHPFKMKGCIAATVSWKTTWQRDAHGAGVWEMILWMLIKVCLQTVTHKDLQFIMKFWRLPYLSCDLLSLFQLFFLTWLIKRDLRLSFILHLICSKDKKICWVHLWNKPVKDMNKGVVFSWMQRLRNIPCTPYTCWCTFWGLSLSDKFLSLYYKWGNCLPNTLA